MGHRNAGLARPSVETLSSLWSFNREL